MTIGDGLGDGIGEELGAAVGAAVARPDAADGVGDPPGVPALARAAAGDRAGEDPGDPAGTVATVRPEPAHARAARPSTAAPPAAREPRIVDLPSIADAEDTMRGWSGTHGRPPRRQPSERIFQ
jgi:hypothetical protein